jgi:hypothetical protein
MPEGVVTGRIMLKRVLILLGPLIAFILYLAVRGNKVPDWTPRAIAAYFILALVVSAVFSHRRSGAATSKYAAVLQSHARTTIWKRMLFFYIYAFLAGSIMVVVLRNTFPLRYLILPLIFNLIFLLLFCWILFWRGSSKSPK